MKKTFAPFIMCRCLGFLLVFLVSTNSHALLIDDFSDGDFAVNPQWFLSNNDDVPGIAEVTDGYVRFFRENVSGNGGTIKLTYDTDIFLTDATSIQFDVNPVYSNVINGAGLSNGEYPINIRLTLLDENDDNLNLQFSYNYRGGESLYESDYIRIAFPDSTQNAWLRGENHIIRNYFPHATKIENIELYATGWNFEGYIDNISVNNIGPVPEPSTMLLLGAGLIGLAGATRRKQKK